MRFAIRSRPTRAVGLVAVVIFALPAGAFAQPSRSPDVARASAGGQPPIRTRRATAADHKNMMEQLGIKTLRPGPSGNESAPNHANYDESLANPYPNLPTR